MIKKSILDFFSFDLSKVDINEFMHIETSQNSLGTKFEKYYKQLSVHELGVFNEIEVLLFPSGEKNFFFNGNLKTLDKPSLQRFLIELIHIYGKDWINSGKLSPQEWIKISKGSYWLGRTWDKKSPTVSINSNNLIDNHFHLSILGVK